MGSIIHVQCLTVMSRDGYNRWRDSEYPSTILHDLCMSNSLLPPIYNKKSVKIGCKKFVADNNTKPDRESLALHALNHWHEMPVIGCHLVPEYVETRKLYNPNFSHSPLRVKRFKLRKEDAIHRRAAQIKYGSAGTRKTTI